MLSGLEGWWRHMGGHEGVIDRKMVGDRVEEGLL